MKPGIYKISNNDYHRGRGLSSSDIKELIKSPLHYKEYKTAPSEPTPEMIRGTVVHALILEPEKFFDQFVVGNFKIRRGKEYDNLIDANPLKTVITSEEHDEACKLVEAFRLEQKENPELNALMVGGQSELSFYWEHTETGVLCKVRPDLVNGTSIVDIKTARDGSFDAFQKAIVDYKYFISAPYYLRGVSETLDRAPIDMRLKIVGAPTRFVFVVIETKAPYAVSIYELDETALRFGEKLIDRALDNYAESVATDRWAGYPKAIIPIALPNYAFYKFNMVGGLK